MKREQIIKGLRFYLGNYTPRNNEYEKGLKYRLFVDSVPTGYTFETLKQGREFIKKNYFIWL